MPTEAVGVPATIVFPIFNFLIKTVQTGFEYASVPEETSNHLRTISGVLDDLKTARLLRDQKAHQLSDIDLSRVDRVILHTEETMSVLEGLVESARVDMSIGSHTVGAWSRTMWVMKDHNSVDSALNSLSLATQSLHGEISMLRNLSIGSCSPRYGFVQGQLSVSGLTQPSLSPLDHRQDTVKALKERREWIARRHSIGQQRHSRPVREQMVRPEQINNPRPLEEATASLVNLADFIAANESMLSALAPSISTGPRNWPVDDVEARMAVQQAYVEAPEGAIELDGGGHMPMPQHRAYSSSDTQLTPIALRSQERPRNSLPTSQLLPAGSTHLARQARSSAILRSLSPVPRTFPSSMMSSTALVPGLSRPIQLEWHEPGEENSRDAAVGQRAVSRATPAGTSAETYPLPEDPPPSYTPIANEAARDEDLEANEASIRTSSRRRPARVHATSQSRASQVQTTEQASFAMTNNTRSTRSLHPRLQWAVERHRADAASLG